MLPHLRLHSIVVTTTSCRPRRRNSLRQSSAPYRSVTLLPKHWLSIARALSTHKPRPQLGVHAKLCRKGHA
jgi:hypothetical protein